MDLSVLASVGSFVVSERVLKPKASVLVLLGCLLAYDLTTKTHDISSLRVYRGPGLLAFTLMMVAFSLRTWRRNGVACDELLFLPDTSHAEVVESAPSTIAGGSITTITTPTATITPMRNEGDVAAGGWLHSNSNNITNHNPSNTQQQGEGQHQDVTLELVANSNTFNEGVSSRNSRSHARSISADSSLSSIREFADSWDDVENLTNEDENEEILALTQTPEISHENDRIDHRLNTTPGSDHPMHVVRSSVTVPTRHPYTRAERFRENHPEITRIGTFFFFRSASTNVQNATYAPSGPSVMGAALDLCMPVLFNFHLYIEAYNHLDAYETETPAKILPLIFLSVLLVRSVFPPGRRGRFWSTIKCTASAPFRRSHFRDLFLGDVLTSLVRPAQDIVFALAYYVTVVWGTATAKYDLSRSGEILETSWLLHNVILPSVALLPLWWKFLQTLRESYDTGKRWPYLGNAFKYLTAALVVLYGMTHPENRRSSWWILAFAIALVYQVFWDTIMDWELFVIGPPDGEVLDGWSESSPWFSAQTISGVRSTSFLMLTVQRVWMPIRDCVLSKLQRFPSLSQIRLRQRRLYKPDSFYWRIFAYNAVFRFCWMLSFIPAYHLSPSGQYVVTTFSSDTNNYVGVLLPIAEIFRRTLWSFLTLEMQTIRTTESNISYGYSQVQNTNQEEDNDVASSVSHSKGTVRHHYLPTWLGAQQQLQIEAAGSSTTSRIPSCFHCDEVTREKVFLAELTVWAVSFVVLGMWACT